MHSECSSLGELSEAKDICLLCKEDQQQPASQTCMEETTIQADADLVTEKPADVPEGAPRQKCSTGMDTTENEPQEDTTMDLGISNRTFLKLSLEKTVQTF